jgi:16S rRNA (cytosine967-C5)-methyltransferase
LTDGSLVAALPRRIALDLLSRVLDRGRPLDEALNTDRRLADLAARDRAFVRTLVAGTLRRLGQIDALIAGAVQRPLPAAARPVRHILRLGVHQLMFLGTAPHAAVATAVALTRSARLDHHAAFVNAVLRRLAREAPALIEGQDAERLNTPAWLWRTWSEAYGEATCRRIAAAHLREPPLDLTARGDPRSVAAVVGGTLLPTGTVRLDHRGPVTALPGFDDGLWWVQDAAAGLPVRLLGDIAGRRVADLCAAPGGKTAQLAAAGARVVAVDRNAPRLTRLHENLQRLALSAETVVADATAWQPSDAFDAVVVDAPCSATGTIRRHPDIAWIKRSEDVASLAVVQRRLLERAMALTRPGGVIVYCACSLQPAEGVDHLAAVTASDVPFVVDPVRAEEVGGLTEAIDDRGALRTLPCHLEGTGGLDGFYAFRLRRP